ncbi:hypothetical protein QJQ45_016276 [Haematococcus lacustris]|nr:hypothetical protein QJQ45_016276 [Haematococcus lacustris]
MFLQRTRTLLIEQNLMMKSPCCMRGCQRGDTEAEHRRMGPGRLVLKGGEPLGGIQKKKAKKPKKVDDVAEGQDGQVEEASVSAVDPSAPKPVDPAAVNVMSGKKYEEEFEVGWVEVLYDGSDGCTHQFGSFSIGLKAAAGGLLGAAWLQFEKLRRETGKARSTPWGSTYRQAPEILHGYTKKVLGVTAEERLDIRASTKADKFCAAFWQVVFVPGNNDLWWDLCLLLPMSPCSSGLGHD